MLLRDYRAIATRSSDVSALGDSSEIDHDGRALAWQIPPARTLDKPQPTPSEPFKVFYGSRSRSPCANLVGFLGRRTDDLLLERGQELRRIIVHIWLQHPWIVPKILEHPVLGV